MTDVFVNGVGWVDVPERRIGFPLERGETWSPEGKEIIRILSETYSLERISWTVGRTTGAIQRQLRRMGVAA